MRRTSCFNYVALFLHNTHREIMIEYYKHNPISDETRRILSVKNSGENNKMYGKKHTDETRMKMRQAWEKRKNK